MTASDLRKSVIRKPFKTFSPERSLSHKNGAHMEASAPEAMILFMSWMSSDGWMPAGSYALRKDQFGRTFEEIAGWATGCFYTPNVC